MINWVLDVQDVRIRFESNLFELKFEFNSNEPNMSYFYTNLVELKLLVKFFN